MKPKAAGRAVPRSRLAYLVPLLALALLAPVAAFADEAKPAAAARPDRWAPLRIFLGEWEGTVAGQPGSGTARRSYALVLNDRFIEVRNESIYPAQERNPQGEHHEDRGMLSYDRAAKKFVLRQFHVEGFVNHYVQESISEDGRTLVFVTTAIENIPAGFRGRETYRFNGADEFTETFELAEPGKEFTVYSETRFTRKR
jgi:hypothetical protein